MAVNRLRSTQHDVVAIGRRKGTIGDIEIIVGQPELENVDTVTLYLNAQHQQQYYDYILSLHPKRIIFNPGAENYELEKLAEENNIKSLHACTLVMLGTRQY